MLFEFMTFAALSFYQKARKSPGNEDARKSPGNEDALKSPGNEDARKSLGTRRIIAIKRISNMKIKSQET